MTYRSIYMIITISLFLSHSKANFVQEMKGSFAEMARYYYPTAGTLFDTEELDGYHRSVIDKMVQQKEDGLTLLYNILYSNLTLSLMRDCLINFTNDDCELFEKYMHSVLDKAVKGETNILEEKLKLYPNRSRQIKDYFNIALLFGVLTTPVDFTEDGLSEQEIKYLTELNSFLEDFNDMIYEDEDSKNRYQSMLNNAAKQLKEMSETINVNLQAQLDQENQVNNGEDELV